MIIGNSNLSRLIRFFAKILGNGLHPSSSLSYICYCVVIHGFFTIIFVLCLNLSIFFITSVEETTHCLYMSLTCLAYAFKVANYFYYHREIFDCVSAVKMFELKNDEEVLIYNRRNDILTWIAYCYYVVPTLCGASAYFKPFLYEDVELPFRAWYPFDWKNVDKYYWIAWGYQAFVMSFNILNNVTLDLTTSYLLNMATIQQEVLALRLSKLGNNISNDKNNNLSPLDPVQHTTLQDLIECIKLHGNILSFTERIQKYYSVGLLAQISLSSTVFCTLAYQLTYTSPVEEFVEYFYYFSFMMSVQIQLYLLCHYGNELIITHNSLTNAVYNSSWYLMSLNCRTLIFIFMERVKRTSQVLVGKLFPLNLETLTAILQFSYRLYALISGTH